MANFIRKEMEAQGILQAAGARGTSGESQEDPTDTPEVDSVLSDVPREEADRQRSLRSAGFSEISENEFQTSTPSAAHSKPLVPWWLLRTLFIALISWWLLLDFMQPFLPILQRFYALEPIGK